MEHANRRRFPQGSLILPGLMLFGCGIVPPQAPPARIPRVGLFHVGLDHVPPSLATLREELHRLGYDEGRIIELDWRNLGDEVSVYAEIERVGRTSLTIAVEAWRRERHREVPIKVTEAKFTFVAVDEGGRPRPVDG